MQGFLDTIGWLVVVGGLGMMLAGQKVLGKNLTPLPKPRDNNTLVTTGIFSESGWGFGVGGMVCNMVDGGGRCPSLAQTTSWSPPAPEVTWVEFGLGGMVCAVAAGMVCVMVDGWGQL